MFGDIFKGRYELYHPPVADGNTNACLLTGKSEYSAEEVKTLLEKSYQFGLPRIRQRIVQYIDYAGETRYKAYTQTVETLVVVRKYAYECKFLDWQKLVDEEELLRSQLPKSVEDNILPRKKYHWMSKTEGGLKHRDYRRAYIDDEDKDEISSYNPVNRKNYPAKEGVYAW